MLPGGGGQESCNAVLFDLPGTMGTEGVLSTLLPPYAALARECGLADLMNSSFFRIPPEPIL